MISMERIILMILFALFAVNTAKAGEGFLEKTSPGRPAKGMTLKKSKVPTFAIHSAKGKIPRLDVGEEASYRGTPASTVPAVPPAPALKPVQKAPAIPVVAFDLKKAGVTPAAPAKSVKATAETLAPLKTHDRVPDPTTASSSVETRKLKELTPSEARLLEAQIVLEKHEDPATALGLLVGLLDDKAVRTEARYSYALAARKLGLASEFRATMMRILADAKDREWGKIATETLVREVEALEIPDMKMLSAEVDKYDVETDKNDAYNFYLAKYFLEAGDLGKVEAALKHVPEKSKYRIDALLVSALSAYRAGDAASAERHLVTMLKEAGKENELRSIGAITLARIRFQRGDYKEASKAYLEVDKSSAQWLDAMTEQAWSQILTHDYEGAAGNMFSLHTDFFKNAFAPESYTARSVAYLNLCQYGDGLQALGNFKRKYGPIVGRIEKYRSEKKAAQDDYDTVRTFLKNTDLKEVNGLPRSFVIELARHPAFLRAQGRINTFEDEIERFNGASLALIQLEKDLLAKQGAAREEQQKIKRAADDGKSMTADRKVRLLQLEKEVAANKMRYDLTKRARGLIKDARTRALARIDKEKVGLKERASKALRQRLQTLTAELTQILEQNEVLQYEIMAGAGEHLRAQSAGAAMGAEKKPEKPDGKSMKWSFKGEIWEDEVGHYRSSLKNVCPKDEQIASY